MENDEANDYHEAGDILRQLHHFKQNIFQTDPTMPTYKRQADEN